jgi:hypothetical protein
VGSSPTPGVGSEKCEGGAMPIVAGLFRSQASAKYAKAARLWRPMPDVFSAATRTQHLEKSAAKVGSITSPLPATRSRDVYDLREEAIRDIPPLWRSLPTTGPLKPSAPSPSWPRSLRAWRCARPSAHRPPKPAIPGSSPGCPARFAWLCRPQSRSWCGIAALLTRVGPEVNEGQRKSEKGCFRPLSFPWPFP